MSEIAYLFGAGASKEVLPVVKDIDKNFNEIIDFLKVEGEKILPDTFFEGLVLKAPEVKSMSEYFNEIVAEMEWLAKEISNHATIDTFAKKLHIKREFEDLKKLKRALSIFFILIQAKKQKPDSRYDTFFASILDNRNVFPNNLRILSWNYDYQFELAYSYYSGKYDIRSNQDILRIVTKHLRSTGPEGFGIYKLNGTTAIYSSDGRIHGAFLDDFRLKVNSTYLLELIKNFVLLKYGKDTHPTMSFAWEVERSSEESIIKMALESIKTTNILVIIGYSFPTFNKRIDSEIFSSMTGLTKIYIQNPSANELKERVKAMFKLDDKIEIIPISDVTQFFIPYEF